MPKKQQGHRQRGAGTVTVSRGEQTRQGVTCKEWQRTPMQLLHEFCQSKKRKKAIFTRVGASQGKFRVRCVLPDDKNSAKDLSFCPEQQVDTMDEAKHCAALLALKYVEPTRPYERTLPDPYRELWLSLDAPAAGAPSSSSSNSNAHANANANANANNNATGRKKDKQATNRPVSAGAGSATASDRASKKTGAESKATSLSVVKPPKQPKDQNNTAVAEANQSKDKESGPTMDFWQDAPSDEEDKDDQQDKKTFPIKLTSDRRFASRAEFEQAKLEKQQQRNKRVRAQENRQRANMNKQVLMSAACRERIEQILKELGAIGNEEKDGNTGEAQEDNAENQQQWEEFDANVRTKLQSMGFQKRHIDGVIRACQNEPRDPEDEYMTRVFDWLCLNIKEGDLPKQFNPQGTQLDVLVNVNSADSAASMLDQSLKPALQHLMQRGYRRIDCLEAIRQLTSAEREQSSESVSSLLLMKLFEKLKQTIGIEDSISDAMLPLPGAEDIASLRQDELFALEAIYDDKMQLVQLDNAVTRVEIAVCDQLRVEFLFDAGSKYPFALPVVAVFLDGDNESEDDRSLGQGALLWLCEQALQQSTSLLGEPMIYDICMAIDSHLNRWKSDPNLRKKEPRALFARPAKPNAVQRMQATLAGKQPQEQQQEQSKPIKKNMKPSQRRSKTHYNTVESAERRARLSKSLFEAAKTKQQDQKFQQMQQVRSRLPAFGHKQVLLDAVGSQQVVLVCGQTGCGKTTQVPQYILEQFIQQEQGGECQIICTQPRRIAAMGVATRVAEERCEPIGQVVGYQIRMEAKKSAETRLLFCTTGVLLRRLLNDRKLEGVSHVIVDEVHERNIETDFLLSILRDLLPKRPDLKLILMSATMNTELFVDYFAAKQSRLCPILEIPGFTYPVEFFFLEDVLKMTSYQIPRHLIRKKPKRRIDDPAAMEDSTRPTKEAEDEEGSLVPSNKQLDLLDQLDESRIDFDMIVHLIKHLVTSNAINPAAKRKPGGSSQGAVLVFLPGIAEIQRLMDALRAVSRELNLWVLPLHGSLASRDQARVFQTAPGNQIKVILSTNVAETSITIEDITVVIDTGKIKSMVYDATSRRSQLLDTWASRASCDQRKGRAGRVSEGKCFRMFTKKRFNQMEAQALAEIHRVSLEQLCLQIKKLELGSIRGFLAKAIEPPKAHAIDAAIRELIEIGAFSLNDDTHQARNSEEVLLTPLGNHLAMLPMDARLGKLLVFGSILRCVDAVATIAACVCSKSPFFMTMDEEIREAQNQTRRQLEGNASDHLLLWQLCELFAQCPGEGKRRAFCKTKGVSFEVLATILELKQQFLEQLDTIGFYDQQDRTSRDHWNTFSTTPRVIKAALCAGLYANVVQVVYPQQKFFQSAHGVLTEQHEAKKIRYFINHPTRERVFLHPSSCNFTTVSGLHWLWSAGTRIQERERPNRPPMCCRAVLDLCDGMWHGYPFGKTEYASPWLMYSEIVQTSKLFVRDTTMMEPYALLLFGGQLQVVHEKNQLVLDDWIHFDAVARIGVLIKHLRTQLDVCLKRKLENPSFDISNTSLVEGMTYLLIKEGM